MGEIHQEGKMKHMLNQKDEIAFCSTPLLRETIEQCDIDYANLSPFQRVLLNADGTLTTLLEAYLLEKLQLIKLSEEIHPIQEDIAPLAIYSGREVMVRKIFLHGTNTEKNWLYAESMIVPDRLEKKLRDSLIQSKTPMGKLWLDNKMELFKNIISLRRELANDLSTPFEVERSDMLLTRSYLVYSNRKPIMLITEKFPESYYM